MRIASILLFIAALGGLGGCDWFAEPEETNFPPETTIIGCPDHSLSPSDSVTIRWIGTDEDGYVSGYEWSYDGADWVATQADSVIIGGLSPGEHRVEVRSIDDKGLSDPTPASCTFTVSSPGTLVDRTVLVELFTTTWCRNCPNAEEALNQLIDDLGRANICIVAYHDTPERDGLATSETADRIDWYWEDSQFPGDADVWPTVVFDGLRVVQGAQSVEKARSDYAFEIGLRQDKLSPMSLEVSGSLAAGAKVRARVRLEHDLSLESLEIHALVIEDSVSYHGWFSDRFDFVVRDLLETHPVTLSTVGDTISVEWSIELDATWDVTHLDVIAFVQDVSTREVVQAARLRK